MPTGDAEYHRAYHAKNRESRNAARKARHALNKDGHKAYCKRYRKENLLQVKKVKKLGYAKKRDTFEGRTLILWRSAKQRARMRGQEFTLTLKHVAEGMSRPCPRTGVTFDLTTLDRSNPYAPSVDKKDRLKPYSDDNVEVVCWAYNRMKGDMSETELLTFCRLILGLELK